MNLVGLMVAVAIMSIGALTSAYFLIDPQIALFRLTAQAQADSIVEALRQASWRGQKVKLIKDKDGNTVVTVDDKPLTIPDNCTVSEPLSAGSRAGYLSINCAGSGWANDRRQALYRSSRTALIGARPCDSDLFPVPVVSKPTDSNLLCTEWNNSSLLPEIKDTFPTAHFDLDSYPGYSTKGLHEHRWDEKYGYFISSSSPGLFDLLRTGDVIPCGIKVSSDDVCSPLGAPRAIPEVVSVPFYLLVTNANLSPMVQIRYQYTYSEVAASSSSMRSTGYTTATTSSSPALVSRESPEIICTQDPLVKDARPFDKCFVLEDPSIATSGDLTALRFSIPSTVKTTPPLGTYILNKLQVGFSVENPQLQAGIIPTTTWKVNSTNSIPGVCGEYRNGAFVIQAVSKLPDRLYRITDSMSTPLPGTTSTCGSKYGMPTRTIKTGVGVFPPVTASIVGTPITSGGGTYISNGGTGLAVDNVVYELSLFWHISSGYTPSMNPMYIPFDVKSVIGYINK